MKNKITLFFIAIMTLFVTSCGTKENDAAADKANKAVTENNMISIKENIHENNEDTTNETKGADMNFDSLKVKNVVIADGNTGNRTELDKSDAADIIKNINDMKFVAIDIEKYTGWSYSIEITYENGETADIIIAGNERINCLKEQASQFYKTDDDIMGLVEKYYNPQ